MRVQRTILIMTLAAILHVPVSCQSSPATEISGEYTLKAQSVQINGVIINIADWPGSSVSVTALDGDMASVSIDSLLPGIDTLTVSADVSRLHGSSYSFATAAPCNVKDREISVSGTVNKGNLSLSITDRYGTPATGRWKVAVSGDGLAAISISFSSPLVTEIPLGDGSSVPVEDALAIVNAYIRSLATPGLEDLEYLEFSSAGYVNIECHGLSGSDLEPLAKDVIQYWTDPADSRLHLYLRRTITDGLGMEISPLDAALAYRQGNGNLTVTLDQQTIAPWTGELLKTIQGFTYDDYIQAGSPLGEITEEQFRQYSTMASLFVTSLSIPGTELNVSAELAPAS